MTININKKMEETGQKPNSGQDIDRLTKVMIVIAGLITSLFAIYGNGGFPLLLLFFMLVSLIWLIRPWFIMNERRYVKIISAIILVLSGTLLFLYLRFGYDPLTKENMIIEFSDPYSEDGQAVHRIDSLTREKLAKKAVFISSSSNYDVSFIINQIANRSENIFLSKGLESKKLELLYEPEKITTARLKGSFKYDGGYVVLRFEDRVCHVYKNLVLPSTTSSGRISKNQVHEKLLAQISQISQDKLNLNDSELKILIECIESR